VKIFVDPPRRRARGLTEEDIALWAEVARSVRRRPGVSPPIEPPTAPPRAALAEPDRPPAAAPPRPAAPPLAPIERKLKRALARGRDAVDGALDLHGLNQAEAHHALRAFLVAAQARGDRLVIVVTGKGRAGSSSWIDEPGVLRRLAPHWLRAPDMRGIVLGFEEAGRAHGGAGALYVRLRRERR
jgi:DNA-nicking Smr family endonuclease